MKSSRQRHVERDNGLIRQIMHVARAFLGQVDKPTMPDILMLMPEDLGGVARHYPASPWQLPELRKLAKDFALLRSAIYQCHLGPSRFCRPTGVLHTFHLPSRTARRGWPRHEMKNDGEHYVGPLADRCRCGQRHQGMTKKGKAFRTPPRAITEGVARWLAQTIINNACGNPSDPSVFQGTGSNGADDADSEGADYQNPYDVSDSEHTFFGHTEDEISMDADDEHIAKQVPRLPTDALDVTGSEDRGYINGGDKVEGATVTKDHENIDGDNKDEGLNISGATNSTDTAKKKEGTIEETVGILTNE